MSIIYDALKKVEPGLKVENKKILNTKPIFIYLGIVVIGLLVAQVLFKFFTPAAVPAAKLKVNVTALKTAQQAPQQQVLSQTQTQQTSPQAQQIQPQPPEPVAMPSLVLNGIFFTGNDGYCLINNQILKVGDEIEGVVVEKIKEQEVELSNKGTTIKLSLGSTQ
ncbi:MAG: type II secretion system protein N [Candidatus Omnitrophica bacterium]|nr:type II secretion system protein N [Candidatus Omnitrophota bacterium]